MVRIIGKLLAIFFLISLHVMHAKVQLSVLSSDGNPIDTLIVGNSYMVVVDIKDLGLNVPCAPVPGLQEFTTGATTRRQEVINGKTRVKHTYYITPHTPGSYTLGPVVVKNNNDTFQSESVEVVVEKSSNNMRLHDDEHKKVVPKQDILLRFSVDKTEVVVGEQVTCTLQLYCDDMITRTGSPYIHQNNFTYHDVTMKKGRSTLNGQSYRVVEWQWHIYPHTSGTVELPAHSIDVEMQDKKQKQWRFSWLQIPRTQRIYSNAITLHVNPLPPHDEPVWFVGTIDKIHSMIEPSVAKNGEGMVLRLEIEGKGDMEHLHAPVFDTMPDGLKCYASKSTVMQSDEKSTHKNCTKQFEYIVQGIQEGHWEIPKQRLSYYDIDAKQYKSVETLPMLVTILASQKTTALQDTPPIIEKDENMTQDLTVLSPLITDYWQYRNDPKILSWWLFMILACIPLCVSMYPCLLRVLNTWHAHNNPTLRAKYAFVNARAQLKIAQRAGDDGSVYTIFITAIAARCCVERERVTQEFVETILIEKKRDALRDKWQDFFSRMIQCSFMSQHDVSVPDDFFECALQWLNEWEKILCK